MRGSVAAAKAPKPEGSQADDQRRHPGLGRQRPHLGLHRQPLPHGGGHPVDGPGLGPAGVDAEAQGGHRQPNSGAGPTGGQRFQCFDQPRPVPGLVGHGGQLGLQPPTAGPAVPLRKPPAAAASAIA